MTEWFPHCQSWLCWKRLGGGSESFVIDYELEIFPFYYWADWADAGTPPLVIYWNTITGCDGTQHRATVQCSQITTIRILFQLSSHHCNHSSHLCSHCLLKRKLLKKKTSYSVCPSGCRGSPSLPGDKTSSFVFIISPPPPAPAPVITNLATHIVLLQVLKYKIPFNNQHLNNH